MVRLTPTLVGILLTSSRLAFANPADMHLASYARDLQRGLDAVRAFEVPGYPCLAREWSSGRLANLSRQREIESDSIWLHAYLAETYPGRLLSSGLDRRGGHFVYLVRLTGHHHIQPQRLRDRAVNVPVIIEYDAPWSFAEIKRRNHAAADRPRKLVPDLQGVGLAAYPGFGAVHMEVYSPSGQPRADVLAQCDALRRLYQLPVLIEFTKGKIRETIG